MISDDLNGTTDALDVGSIGKLFKYLRHGLSRAFEQVKHTAQVASPSIDR